MAKTRTQFVCQQCGSTSPKWMGRCTDCGEWNTLVETVVESKARTPLSRAVQRSKPQRLSEVTSDGLERLQLPMPEFSRVLGGGIVPGSLVLVGGDPGIGKSTLLLQVSALMAEDLG
ncbi:MAG: AAA family ATPase, partial [Anaerolineae bacterium]